MTGVYWYARHQACGCGYGWYGPDDSQCLWCAARLRDPALQRPIDVGIDARTPSSHLHAATEAAS